MLTEKQKKWIEALRSGKYKQGRGFLKKDNCFCCLGVACEIFKEELNLEVTDDEYDCSNDYLPLKVVKFLNLVSDSGANVDPNIDMTLVMLNDDMGMSFEEIANELETGAYFRTEEMD